MIQDKPKKLIIYELNEVPLKVLKEYVRTNPKSNFAQITKSGIVKETYTIDEGELHPWSTWPTVHRGVSNNIHKIQFINQNLDYSRKWPPIWEILLKNKLTIGIFGSLQSYPPIKDNLVSFYLPDTFSPRPDSLPLNIMDFQRFNLAFTERNKAISRKIFLNDYLIFLKLILKGNFKIDTILSVLKHLFLELYNPKNKSLRSLMQPILGFDIYFKLLEKEKPHFSTFFTNHVAGMMHRYWKYAFPEDFKSTKTKNFHNKSIKKAMKIADKQVGKLLKFCESNNFELWIISSMGQEAILRDNDFPEIYLSKIDKVISSIGLNPSSYKLLPAMQPDLCINCKDQVSLSILLENIQKIKDLNGVKIFKPRYKNDGLNVNISIQHSLKAYKVQKFLIEGETFLAEDLNIEFVKRDIGTGYHSKKGIYIGYGNKSKKIFKSYKDKDIDTRDFFNKIKLYFGIKL